MPTKDRLQVENQYVEVPMAKLKLWSDWCSGRGLFEQEEANVLIFLASSLCRSKESSSKLADTEGATGTSKHSIILREVPSQLERSGNEISANICVVSKRYKSQFTGADVKG